MASWGMNSRQAGIAAPSSVGGAATGGPRLQGTMGTWPSASEPCSVLNVQPAHQVHVAKLLSLFGPLFVPP